MKKAQIHLTETIAVLFIFFVLILFGIIFYARYQKIALEERQEEALAKRAIDITTRALFLPELICSEGEAEPEDHCFDLMKLRVAKEVFKKYLDKYYFDLFSYATITVKEIYPGDNEWVLYDKKKSEYERVEPTYFIITLRDEIPETSYRFGFVKVEVYS